MELKEYIPIGTIVVSAIAIFWQIKNTNKQIQTQIENTNKQIQTQNEMKKLDYEYKRKEKSIEMATIFQEMFRDTTYIVHVLEKTKIKEKYYEKIKFNELKRFDYNELIDKFGEKNLKEIENLSNPKNLNFNEFANAYVIFNLANPSFISLVNGGNNDDIKRAHTILITDFYDRRTEVLNKLEWFAMNFTSGLADEDVVYQSLHQVFLSSVKLFHFEISSRNINGTKDKYYCHIIELYKKWSEHYHAALEKEKLIEEKKLKDLKELDEKRAKKQEEHNKLEEENIKKAEKFKGIS